MVGLYKNYVVRFIYFKISIPRNWKLERLVLGRFIFSRSFLNAVHVKSHHLTGVYYENRGGTSIVTFLLMKAKAKVFRQALSYYSVIILKLYEQCMVYQLLTTVTKRDGKLRSFLES